MGFLRWISQHASALDLKITRVTELSRHIPHFNDYEVKITVRGQIFVGRGRGWSADEALRKSCGEALERSVFGLGGESSGRNTNGWALGLTPEDASRRAIAELIERDAFLCHYYTTTPFFDLPDAKLSPFDPYLEVLKQQSIEVVAGSMETSNGMPAVCVTAFGDAHATPFGSIVGLGCADTFEAAQEKAYMECLTHLSAFLELKQTAVSWDAFRGLSHVTPEDQGALALSVESLPFVRPLFEGGISARPRLLEPFIEVDRISLPPELSGAPVFVCRARSTSLQALEFGDRVAVNTERLASFTGQSQPAIVSFPQPLA